MQKWRPDKMILRTDLAVEERESFPGDGGEVSGVVLKEWEQSGIHMTEVVIKNEAGARNMGKPVGTYLTLEAPGLSKDGDGACRETARELEAMIRRLLKRRGIMGRGSRAPSILAVGLGNPAAAPDALGPRVLGHLTMTRHLEKEYGDGYCAERGYPILSGITPGVMAQTGMETAEIIRGIAEETGPDLIIGIDALAARNVSRLGVTVQLSDTGIHPGSGVGNHRNGLTEETLGIPVLAIGAPTVVGAAAIVHGTVGAMIEVLRRETGTRPFGERIEAMEPEEQYELIREILEPRFGPMYVTPHTIDEQVDRLSFIIAEAIHGALFQVDSRC